MFIKLRNLFKNEEKQHNYLVDIHSHLIPGIDDGSKSMEQSVEMITRLKNMGFKKLITTPHIMQYEYDNTPDIILGGLKELQEVLKQKNIDIEIEAASEYFLDQHFLELIQKKDLLTFGDNYLLFELSYTIKPVILENAVFSMISQGYNPVLAHPERYLFMHKNFDEYRELKEKGVLFQVNLNSFSGYYSKAVKDIANRLAEEGMIDFIGSDTHKHRQLDHLEKNLQSNVIKKIFKYNTIRNESLL
jgi:tyrosine-protein phosphatase YwqE